MQAILPSQLKTGVLMADRRAMVSSRTLPMRPPRRTVAASCPADDSHEVQRALSHTVAGFDTGQEHDALACQICAHSWDRAAVSAAAAAAGLLADSHLAAAPLKPKQDERVGSMRSVADMAADRDLTKRRVRQGVPEAALQQLGRSRQINHAPLQSAKGPGRRTLPRWHGSPSIFPPLYHRPLLAPGLHPGLSLGNMSVRQECRRGWSAQAAAASLMNSCGRRWPACSAPPAGMKPWYVGAYSVLGSGACTVWIDMLVNAGEGVGRLWSEG